MPMIDYGDLMKIPEDEKPGEKVPPTPKGIGNPGIEVVVVLGRRVVGDHRRSLGVVVVVDDRGVIGLLDVSIRLLPRGLLACIGGDVET